MKGTKTLYDEAVEITEEFLGPAGERFLNRQIVTHLNIEPEELERKHLQQLVEWVRLTFAVLTDDANHVEAFSKRLLALEDREARTPQLTKAGHGGDR